MFTKDTGSIVVNGRLCLGLVWELTQLGLYSGKTLKTNLHSGSALAHAWEWIEGEDEERGTLGIPSIFEADSERKTVPPTWAYVYPE